jgi:hypothetical protein
MRGAVAAVLPLMVPSLVQVDFKIGLAKWNTNIDGAIGIIDLRDVISHGCSCP